MSGVSSFASKLVTPLALLFNAVLLVQFHSASACNSCNTVDKSTFLSFIARMQSNGIDNLEIMDLVFCGCVVILAMEAMNIATKQIASEFISRRQDI